MLSRSPNSFAISLQACSCGARLFSCQILKTFQVMAKLKDQLTSEVAGIILRHVRTPKGRLTEISDDSKINRKDFNVHGLSQMKLHRFLRILYALNLSMDYEEYQQMMDEISDTITEFAGDYDYTLLDE